MNLHDAVDTFEIKVSSNYLGLEHIIKSEIKPADCLNEGSKKQTGALSLGEISSPPNFTSEFTDHLTCGEILP